MSMPVPSAIAMQPVAIDGCAGWLHGEACDHGVVLCGASGFEALCGYQSWRVFADILAARGTQVLRFDYPGEGDSLDDARPGLEARIEIIGKAIDWMKARPGVTRVSVAGIRLGALLALRAIAGRNDIHGVALLALPRNGKTYLREQRAAAALFAHHGADPVEDGALNLCGHVVTKEAFGQIAALERLTPPDGTRCLIAGGTVIDIPEIPIDHLPFDGQASMFAPPTAAMPPFEDFRHIADWLTAEPATPVAQPAPSPPEPLHGPDFSEERVLFGTGNRLAGVLCQPLRRRPGSQTVLFLNAGANAHVGWARMSVDQARTLASHGIASLRMDLSGIGDSDWTEAGPRPLLYSSAHVADACVGVEMLIARGLGPVMPVGICAGGYTALQAAAHDPRITSVLAANVLRLHWSATDDLDTAERALNQSSSAYAAKALSTSAWKRLLTLDVSPARVVGILGLIGKTVLSRTLGRLLAAMGIEFGVTPDSRAVRAMFSALSQRGCAISLVYSDRDAGRDELDRHMGPAATRFLKLPGTHQTLIPGADHEFTPKEARDRLFAAILAASKSGQ